MPPALIQLRRSSAFTLMELLVATGIMAVIGMILVGLLKGGLDLWHRGESNRDVFERAQVVLEMVGRDLETVVVDRGEVPPLPELKPLAPRTSGKALVAEKGLPGRPGLHCGRDRRGRPVLRLTRAARPEIAPAPAAGPAGSQPKTPAGRNGATEPGKDKPGDGADSDPKDKKSGADKKEPDDAKDKEGKNGKEGGGETGKEEDSRNVGPKSPADAKEAAAALALLNAGGLRDLEEVLYALDPDPAEGRFYRLHLPGPVVSERAFEEAILGSRAFFDAAGSEVAHGILYVGYSFWAPGTTTWREEIPPRRSGSRSTGEAGPDLRWDSTRLLDRDFALFLKDAARLPPTNDVLPAMVRVAVTVEADPGRTPAVTLDGGIGAADDQELAVSASAELPDPPDVVRIDDEWIRYSEKSGGTLKIEARGARGSARVAHEAGARVRFGRTFETTIAIPAGQGSGTDR